MPCEPKALHPTSGQKAPYKIIIIVLERVQ